MEWQTRRKIIYALSVIVIIVAFLIYIFREQISPTPTCFDTKQNNFESGIDCGGTCNRMCDQEVIPLSVLWTWYLKTSDNVYDLVAMISNTNTNNSAYAVSYTFTTYNEKGDVIDVFTGSAKTPIASDFPIIRQDVYLKEEPKNVTFTIKDDTHFKVAEKTTSPIVRISGERYEDGEKSRVYAIVKNMKQVRIMDLKVRVLLYDQDNNVYAVGKTEIPFLEQEENREISFTWKEKLPFAPLRIKVYPIIDPFLSTDFTN